MRALHIAKDVSRVIARGGLLAINHSGGKDSQAMTLRLLEAGIPRDQIVIVHACLGDVEWPGTLDHIRATTFGLPSIIARPRKSFFEIWRFAFDLCRAPLPLASLERGARQACLI